MIRLLIAVLTTVTLGACAHAPAYDPQDPLEAVNRKVYKFNDVADRYVLRPVAKTYADITPQPVKTGVSNFFDNLTYPITIVNGVLQLKFKQAASDTGRFLLNSTVGILGLVDVAGQQGMERHDEDFGQTLGYWGVGEGWFLMLPLLGPSTNRDLIGRGGDYFSDPTYYVDEPQVEYPLIALRAVNSRAGLLGAPENFLNQQLDPYVAMRTAYLEQRWSLIHDGKPPPDDDFEDFGDE